MSVADELDRLHRLHQDGVLTDEELDRGRAAVLVALPASPTADQLEEIRRQKEAARLDREWEVERERYMARDKAGDRYIPTRAGYIACAIVCVAFGVFWVVVSVRGNMPGLALLVGVVAAVAGVALNAFAAVKAGRYLKARRRYQERRVAIVNGEEPPAEPTC
jgi:hypothetical protein